MTSPYVNQVAHNDQVWARVEYDPSPPLNGTGCFSVIPLELIVNPLPDDTIEISNVIHCQVPFTGTSSIILDDKDIEILNGLDPLVFDVLYFESELEADTMTDPISSSTPFFFNAIETTIHVGILNIETNCYVSSDTSVTPSLLTFTLIVKEGAVATEPMLPYTICDNTDPNDGIAEFDLLNYDFNINGIDIIEEILGGQDPIQYVISYHETLASAEAGDNPLPNIYTNIINPQIIYARVTNTDTDCYAIAEVTLKVELIPDTNLDETYRLCVDEYGNPIPAEEGASSPPVIDTGLDPSIYIFKWELNGEELLGEIGASITALQAGVYTVTVTELLTGCMASFITTVVNSTVPLVYNVEITEAFASQHNVFVTVESGSGDYIYQLDDNPFQETGTFLDVQPGSHTITIKDANGCGFVTIDVGIIDYPQFMTPNQDGYHDTWNIIGIANGDPTAKIYIFNRFGKLLKQLSPLSEGWDGSYNGNPMPSSDYWFRVEYIENDTNKEFRGHFTLKR